MTFKSSDVGKVNKVNKQSVDEARAVFEGLDKDILSAPDHPLAREYAPISVAAKTILDKIAAAMGIPGGFPIIEQCAEKLGELHARAVEIRNQIAKDLICKDFGVAPGVDIDTVLEPMMEKATESIGESGATLMPRFKQVIATLGMDFSADPKGALKAISKSRKFLEEARTMGAAAPEIVAFANRLSTGLDRMAAINPTIAYAVAHDQWKQENFSGKRIDYKPVRMIGALVGSFILTLNLGHAAYTGTNPLTLVTGSWGLATMLFMNPKIVRDSGSRTVEAVASMGSSQVLHAHAQGFKGPLVGPALDELLALRESKRTELTALQNSKEPLTMAQIGHVAGENSALTQVLAGMPARERAEALLTFGSKPMSLVQRDVAKTLLG